MMSTALLWEFLVCRLLLLVVVFLVEEQQTTMTLLLVFSPVEEAVVEDLLFWKSMVWSLSCCLLQEVVEAFASVVVLFGLADL